jgi:protein involved in polysaccharide export with SLBB domain
MTTISKPRRPACWLTAAWVLAALALPRAAAGTEFTAEPPVDWAKVAEYRLQPGDELRLDFGFNLLENRYETADQKVRQDGRITVFPVGDILAAGLTPTELDSSITRALRGELREPRVTVTVVRSSASTVHVLGRVEKPGSYAVEGMLTVLRAISLAGGFKDDAARNSVLVFHRQAESDVQVARVPVDRMLKGARLDQDYQLRPYDIVYVPRSTIGNVNVFSKQFFGEQGQMLSAIFIGWQLFHLDRIFLVTPNR